MLPRDVIRNNYFHCLAHSADPTPIGLEDPSECPSEYIFGVLKTLEQHLQVDGMTFYLTWKIDELPSYGEKVVAISLGDEWSRIPTYAGKVLATFKCYGTKPQLEVNPFREPSYLNGLLAVKYVRTRLYHLPGKARHLMQQVRHLWRGEGVPPVYEFPLGYGNQRDLKIKPIGERPTDVFFAGSVKQREHTSWWSPQRWLRSPKNVSREQMLDKISVLAQQVPQTSVRVHTNQRFVLNALSWGTTNPGEVLDEEAYSRALVNTKICLVPRGTSAETFRFFEGLRYGCVLITERLPSRWFYDGSPANQVDDWRELIDLVPALLDDPARLQRLHEEALRWWKEVCSEEVVGRAMAEKINTLKHLDTY